MTVKESRLLVMVPTRGRREQCERLLVSFHENTDAADIIFIIDPDDEETYEGVDWGAATTTVLSPRGSLSEKLNSVSVMFTDDYEALMFIADDNTFSTKGWDTILMDVISDMGGTGMVYPDDKRRTDVPEIILITTDIVKELGFFAVPDMKHYYLDNSWAELGSRANLIRFVPEVVIEHLHYAVAPVTRDLTYSYAEETWGQRDAEAWQAWRTTSMGGQVAVLRRAFNRDLSWVLDRV